ncbi:Uu.00g072380.m01.CDS01 [Anthostomella pinea]|uniref:Uu.00g072380.m01.CDS01 n=1 Tax=Anthostomella pinea TaxID=933095 RepID=A0AAI8YNU1_9PEZI|nr:Uu.00g072380.m01.CDS01 [Anthostomella pinea]
MPSRIGNRGLSTGPGNGYEAHCASKGKHVLVKPLSIPQNPVLPTVKRREVKITRSTANFSRPLEKCNDHQHALQKPTEPPMRVQVEDDVSSTVAQVGCSSTVAGPGARFLPGCSGGKHKEKQIVSNAMMQAYVKMRGPCMGGNEDPLFDWIRLREDLPAREFRKGHKKDVSRMLELIDKALDPLNGGGDSPRDAVFEVERPDIQHIQPPADMDLSLHAMTASCADFVLDEEDEDDEEGNIPNGRISPCTFLDWAKDCKRWDDQEIKLPFEEVGDKERQRPPTPLVPATPKDHFPHYYNGAVDQVDEDSGEILSPAYDVPSSPSIIYTPPGVATNLFPSATFQASYTRMAPLAAREFRRAQYGGPDCKNKAPDKDEYYSYTEVETAVAAMPDAGSELPHYLSQQWLAVRANEATEAVVHTQTIAQRQRIANLEADIQKLTQYLPALQQQRARQAGYAQQREAADRAARIKEHVAAHARDAQHRFDLSWYKLVVAQRRAANNEERIAALRREIDGLCATAGKREPGQVFEEVDRGMTVEEMRELDEEVDRIVDDIRDGGGMLGPRERVPGSFRSFATDL